MSILPHSFNHDTIGLTRSGRRGGLTLGHIVCKSHPSGKYHRCTCRVTLTPVLRTSPLPATLTKPRCKARGRARQKVRANTETPSSCFLWTLLCGMLCRCLGVVPARSLTSMAAKEKQDNSMALGCCFALCRRREVAATRRGEVCIVLDPPHCFSPSPLRQQGEGAGG